MLPVVKEACVLKIKLYAPSIGAAFRAVSLPSNGTSWNLQNHRRNIDHGIRRSLFELHAGREAPQLSTDLPLEKLSWPQSKEEIWFNTSEELIEALGPVGQDYARPKEYEGRADLSFTDPSLAAQDHMSANALAEEAKARQSRMREEGKHGRSRKEILISYLRHVDPVLNYQARLADPAIANAQLLRGLQKVFDKGTSLWLGHKDLDITDIMNWAWILSAKSSERAALRLMLLTCTPPEMHGMHDRVRPVPQFVFTFLLRRNSIEARALRLLLIYAWKLLGASESSAKTPPIEDSSAPDTEHPVEEVRNIVKDGTNGMLEHVFLILTIRLLRRARKVWPAAYKSIVALLNRYLDGLNFRRSTPPQNGLQPHQIKQLTYMYNTMLRLLSLPSSVHPFQSAIFQQRAQFSLLRRMARFKPQISVDKRGYQAFVKLQIMHKKTLREREWAHMKAKSWPPWKRDKLGIDAAIGTDHGISRAKEALSRAEESGYSTDSWDAAASILSGWDSDLSPTIQMRSVMKYPLSEPKQSRESRQGAVWAARVQATRTLDEAWSCFLAWKDQALSVGSGQHVYLAMFQKIVYNPQAFVSDLKDLAIDELLTENSLPGDGLEVTPPTGAHSDAVYVRRPAPDFEDLLEMMRQEGIKASGRLLAFLIAKAPSFEVGIKCLEARFLRPPHLQALLGGTLAKNQELQYALQSIPTHLFAGVIEFLARFAPTMADKGYVDLFEVVKTGVDIDSCRGEFETSYSTTFSDQPLFNPLAKAHELLLARKPRYRPAWYHLFRALVRPQAVTGVYSRLINQKSQDIKTWRMICSLLDHILDNDLRIDLDGFNIICRGLEKAIFASERRLRFKARFRTQVDGDQIGEEDSHHSVHCENQVLSRGVPLVKGLFKDAVRSTSMQQEVPYSVIVEKSKVDEDVEGASDSTTNHGNLSEAEDEQPAQEEGAFLPPACLLPRLQEIPHPAHLHAFIRVLGLRRDYDGILDLVEWMSLFADEINMVAEEAMNGRRMMRRCMTAMCVFLERSWMDIPRNDGYDLTGYEEIVVEAEPAPEEIVQAVYDIVLENKKWGGWPTEDKIVEYCSKGKFL